MLSTTAMQSHYTGQYNATKLYCSNHTNHTVVIANTFMISKLQPGMSTVDVLPAVHTRPSR